MSKAYGLTSTNSSYSSGANYIEKDQDTKKQIKDKNQTAHTIENFAIYEDVYQKDVVEGRRDRRHERDKLRAKVAKTK